MAGPPTLEERFRVEETLGRGAQGTTFLATDLERDELVALKRLAIRSVGDWKAVELFEREGRVLRALDHPAIPSYVDAFVLDEDTDDPRFFLVQEYIEGVSLADQLADGRRFDEAEVVDFLEQMLRVLRYLGELHPPVIHRDIKPANILRRPDGRYALVDFGAVQAIIPAEQGGSTVVGTSGYLPIEQIMGRAEPSSDLYALAATAVQLLSGRHPSELSEGGLQVQVRDAVEASPGLIALLEAMLAAYPEDRVRSAKSALERLESLDDTPHEAPDDALVRAESRQLSPVERRQEQVLSTFRRRDVPKDVDFGADGGRLVLTVVGSADWKKWLLGGFIYALLFGLYTLVMPGWIGTGLVAWFVAFSLLVVWYTRGSLVEIGADAVTHHRRLLGLDYGAEQVARDEIDDVVIHQGKVKLLSGAREIDLVGIGKTERAKQRSVRNFLRAAIFDKYADEEER